VAGYLKPFDGFVGQDFAIYVPEKWTSNVFNLQRMQVKQKLDALGAALAEHVTPWDLDLEHETSSERPSIWNQKKVQDQWLYFFRNARAQKELQTILDRERTIAQNVDDPAHHHRHMVLGLRVDHHGAAVLCLIHRNAWLDRRNLQNKWEVQHERVKLMYQLSLLKDLGIAWVAGETRRDVAGLDEATVEADLADADKTEGWLGLERLYATGDAALESPGFAQECMKMLEQILPFYRFAAWGKGNDFVSLAKMVDDEKKAKRRHSKAPFEENDAVEIVGGLFAGRKGIVQGYDKAGKVKIKVGTLTLPVDAGSLKKITHA
jgi:hypothetical protein